MRILRVYKMPKIICYFLEIGFGGSLMTLPLKYPNRAQHNDENHTMRLGCSNLEDFS